jgi:hypothetical protein
MSYLDSAPISQPDPPSKPEERNTPDARLRKYWREIEAYGKATENWTQQAEKIVKLYLDQHRTAASPRRFALLWSNIETLKPAVYAKLPTVLCSRRYKDPHPIGRVAAELLERATNTVFDLYAVDETFRMVRDDRLLAGRGQAWVRYEADFTKAGEGTDQYDKVTGERVCVDYVHWCDFGHNVAGTWSDVWLVWRRVYKTREEAEKRFGIPIAEKLTYAARVDLDGNKEAGENVACIYELWDRRERKTLFMSKDVPIFLEEGDPPLDFRNFFPCPEPCYGTKTGKSLIPTPDYRYYQDQANEIDDLTDKIANLTEYLMVRAFVPAGPSADGADAVRDMIETLQDGMTRNKSVFVPVESWAGFTDRGGAGKLIDWLPIDLVTVALKGAVETRSQLIQDVYQITGIADILRGETDPNETLGAQQLKAQTGQRRVRNAKDDHARHCRDLAQLVAEVIAEQFQPQTIADMTGYAYAPMLPVSDPAKAQTQPSPPMQPMPPQIGTPGVMPQPQGLPAPVPAPGMPPLGAQASPSGQTFNDDVIRLLRNDRMRGFLIDIETDSTIQPDEDAEKQRRTELITALGGFMNEAAQILPMAPSLAPMVSESLLFLVRGFRAGRSLEEVIERSMQQLQQQLMQPKPDPEQMKMEGQLKLEKQKAAIALFTKQQELQIGQQKAGQEGAIKAQTASHEAGLRAQESQHEMQIRETEVQHEMGLRAQEAVLDHHLTQQQGEQKLALAQRAAAAKQRGKVN